MDVKSKILEYIEYKQISRNSVEKTLGWSKSTIYNAANMRVDKLSEFVQTYEDISLDWLLRDEGSMIREKGTNNIEEPSNVERVDIRDSRKFDAQLNFSSSKIKNLDARYLQILANTAESFSRTNEELELKIEELRRENALLKKKIAER